MAQNVTRAGDRQNLGQQRARFRAARLVDLEQLSGMKIKWQPGPVGRLARLAHDVKAPA